MQFLVAFAGIVLHVHGLEWHGGGVIAVAGGKGLRRRVGAGDGSGSLCIPFEGNHAATHSPSSRQAGK